MVIMIPRVHRKFLPIWDLNSLISSLTEANWRSRCSTRVSTRASLSPSGISV